MLSFRLWTIFYVFALLAAAMATLGARGIFVAVTVLGFWAWISNGPEPSSCLRWVIHETQATRVGRRAAWPPG
jgi:hypothetical protein